MMNENPFLKESPYILRVDKFVEPTEKEPFQVAASLECRDTQFKERLENILPERIISYRNLLWFEKTFRRQPPYYKFITTYDGVLGSLYATHTQSLNQLLSENGLRYKRRTDKEIDLIQYGLKHELNSFLDMEYRYLKRLIDKQEDYMNDNSIKERARIR
ncbi:hypothetical protein [Paenibacillus sp. FSL L8-0333]|uniref:hypothetical protein n=1 Tax=Paenibacillus sp. FSL L8-0333 TaxID=2975331 RepID=UPI0030D29CFE